MCCQSTEPLSGCQGHSMALMESQGPCLQWDHEFEIDLAIQDPVQGQAGSDPACADAGSTRRLCGCRQGAQEGSRRSPQECVVEQGRRGRLLEASGTSHTLREAQDTGSWLSRRSRLAISVTQGSSSDSTERTSKLSKTLSSVGSTTSPDPSGFTTGWVMGCISGKTIRSGRCGGHVADTQAGPLRSRRFSAPSSTLDSASTCPRNLAESR